MVLAVGILGGLVTLASPAGAQSGGTRVLDVQMDCNAATNRATITGKVVDWSYTPAVGRVRVSVWDAQRRVWASIGAWGSFATNGGLMRLNDSRVLRDGGVFQVLVEVQYLTNYWPVTYSYSLAGTYGYTTTVNGARYQGQACST